MVKLGLKPKCVEIQGPSFSSHFEYFRSIEELRAENNELFTIQADLPIVKFLLHLFSTYTSKYFSMYHKEESPA